MQYRRITRACAGRDWAPATTHDEVLEQNAANDVLKRFLAANSLDHCYAGRNAMDRTRDCKSAGSHVLGNFHIKAPAARRAWLWRDTGELNPIGSEFEVDWMIAEGPRRKGDKTDLQQSHKDVLCDPDDGWLPSPDDYDDLIEAHTAAWIDRAQEAIAEAAFEAEHNRNELIRVDIDKVIASVAQGDPVVIEAAVIEEYSERWFILERLRGDKTPISYAEASILAHAAFEGIEKIDEIFEETAVLDGRFVIKPAIHYAWCAVV